MICPNCGRRNSAGATFCSRCHQRLPLANKLTGNQRRVVMVEPRGGGGSGAIVLGVALLAGFLFIGGAAAIYLRS
ncbi:MAG: zinc ribbon domain-containing protein, partial [Chloroflexota bacterium]|nr:zinc ribbon domain-containing protein [Chloroflexota bacterium]